MTHATNFIYIIIVKDFHPHRLLDSTQIHSRKLSHPLLTHTYRSFSTHLYTLTLSLFLYINERRIKLKRDKNRPETPK